MKTLLQLTLLLLGIFLLLISGVLASRADETYNIAFLSNRDGNYEIFLMSRDGTTQDQITYTAPRVGGLRFGYCWLGWLGDGKSLVGIRSQDRPGTCAYSGVTGDLYHINPYSGSSELVNFEAKHGYTPVAQSSDGQAFLFMSYIREGATTGSARQNLNFYNLLTRQETNLNQFESREVDIPVHWSPDGQWIVYMDGHRGRYSREEFSDIYRMRPDGTAKQTMLTEALSGHPLCDNLAISTDSQWVTFTVTDDKGNCTLLYRTRLTADIFGEDTQPLINLDRLSADHPLNYSTPMVSPNGKWLAFWQIESGTGCRLEVVPIPDRHPNLITPTLRTCNPDIDWSPDGQWLLFAGLNNAHYDVYRLNLQNGSTEHLTIGDYDNQMPRYSPLLDSPYRAELPLFAGFVCLVGVLWIKYRPMLNSQ